MSVGYKGVMHCTVYLICLYFQRENLKQHAYIQQDDIFEYDVIVAVDNTSKTHWTLLVSCPKVTF